MSYNVYTAEFHGVPNHVAIFVATNSDGSGRLFHVVGNILRGMAFETKPGKNPEKSNAYVPDSMILVGAMKRIDISRFEEACKAVEVPGAQLRLNGKRKDPSKPVRRCGEWVQDAIAKLIADAIISPA